MKKKSTTRGDEFLIPKETSNFRQISGRIHSLFFILTLSLLVLFANNSFSQQVQLLTGKVTDSSKSSLPGVSVVIKGTTNGTITDLNGNYSLPNVPINSTIQFSFVGMKSQEINVGSKTVINISLEEETIGIDEVVAIGYGTQKKGEVTSSITNVKATELIKGNVIDPAGMLQGKVAGLNVVNGAGADPNGKMELNLRGITSLSGGTSPLIIIDGVIGASLSSVNTEEIESFDILKDGSAAAIYGTRGTNGVIIITTKKAKSGLPTVEFSSYVTTQTVAKKLQNLSASEFRDALKLIYPGRESEFDHGASTDWFNEISRTPLDQNYNVAFSAGSDKFSYRASLNYRDSQSIIRKNSNNRMVGKVTINQKGFNDRLNVNYNLGYEHTNSQYADTWVLQQAFRYNPTEPVYDPTNTVAGGYYRNAGPFDYYNPVAMINERTNEGQNDNLTASTTIDFRLNNFLKINALGSIIRNNFEQGDYRGRYYPIGLGTNGTAYNKMTKNYSKLLELSGDFKKDLGHHNIQFIGGYSYQEEVYREFDETNSNFDTDLFLYNNIGAGYGISSGNASMTSYKRSNKLISFFGRFLYNFNEKYLLSASTRYEGSTRFGANNKWGLFPSVSLGWRINKEDFLSNVTWLSDLKLRAGYGVTGNQDIGDYQSLQLLKTGGKFLNNGKWTTTYPPASNPNPDLKWERKAELDLGFDFGVLKNRISGTFDYYVRNTNDLLFTYDVPVPPNLYNTIFANVGKMRNSGVEVTVNATPIITKNFKWNTTLIYSSNRNKLISFSDKSKGYELTKLNTGWMPADLQTWTHQIIEGGAIGNFVTLVFEGIDSNGQSKFKDVNTDGKIDDNDRVVTGNAYPKFIFSFNNTFSWKNFDLSFLLRGSYGNEVLDIHRIYYENFGYFGGKNILLSALDYPNFKGKAELSSRYVEDASYIKLDNLSIGYNLKPEGKIFKNARIYVTGQQLLTITKYKGVDPEITLTGLAPGVDAYSYFPRTRKFTLGLNLTF